VSVVPPASSGRPHSTAKPQPGEDSDNDSDDEEGGHHHPYPVTTTTIIIVVPTFTHRCHGPTTIIGGTETVTVTEIEPTTVTFTKGPYTRTKTHLECHTTTTEYYDVGECGCGGWPYATGEGYTPISHPTPAVTSYPSDHAPKPSGAPVVKPSAIGPPAYPPKNTTTPKNSPVFTSGAASHSSAGVVALIAGVVAYMVL
jgi:hypothetical protein